MVDFDYQNQSDENENAANMNVTCPKMVYSQINKFQCFVPNVCFCCYFCRSFTTWSILLFTLFDSSWRPYFCLCAAHVNVSRFRIALLCERQIQLFRSIVNLLYILFHFSWKIFVSTVGLGDEDLFLLCEVLPNMIIAQMTLAQIRFSELWIFMTFLWLCRRRKKLNSFKFSQWLGACVERFYKIQTFVSINIRIDISIGWLYSTKTYSWTKSFFSMFENVLFIIKE